MSIMQGFHISQPPAPPSSSAPASVSALKLFPVCFVSPITLTYIVNKQTLRHPYFANLVTSGSKQATSCLQHNQLAPRWKRARPRRPYLAWRREQYRNPTPTQTSPASARGASHGRDSSKHSPSSPPAPKLEAYTNGLSTTQQQFNTQDGTSS